MARFESVSAWFIVDCSGIKRSSIELQQMIAFEVSRVYILLAGALQKTFRMKLSVFFDWIFDEEISAWWCGMKNFAPYQHFWLCWRSHWFYWPSARRLRTNRVSLFIFFLSRRFLKYGKFYSKLRQTNWGLSTVISDL